MVDDMDVDLDKEFLQDLKDLKMLITDKDLLDQHKRYLNVSKHGFGDILLNNTSKSLSMNSPVIKHFSLYIV